MDISKNGHSSDGARILDLGDLGSGAIRYSSICNNFSGSMRSATCRKSCSTEALISAISTLKIELVVHIEHFLKGYGWFDALC